MALRSLIRDVPDFPEPGIVYKDITPLLADSVGFDAAMTAMTEPWIDSGITMVVGVEARGFIFGAPVARSLGAGFVPVRKPGRLPSKVESFCYELEYGSGVLEMHSDALSSDDRVLVIDDVLATGGTAEATAMLVGRSGAELVGFGFLIELAFLHGRAHLGDVRIEAQIIEEER